jgi:hypothetical protein
MFFYDAVFVLSKNSNTMIEAKGKLPFEINPGLPSAYEKNDDNMTTSKFLQFEKLKLVDRFVRSRNTKFHGKTYKVGKILIENPQKKSNGEVKNGKQIKRELDDDSLMDISNISKFSNVNMIEETKNEKFVEIILQKRYSRGRSINTYKPKHSIDK